jgi:hypothetical protein
VKTTEPVAILNGFGVSLGDGIIGLQALAAARALGVLGRPVLLRRNDCRQMVDALYGLAADFADIAPLPDELPADFAARFDRVIDIRDFAFDPAFRGVAMIDFFLARLGLMPAGVPAELRRNAWLAPRIAPTRPAGLPEGYVLFCPRASMAQRDMPASTQARLLRILLESQTLPVITQGSVPPGMEGRVGAAPDCASIAELCALVAGAACIVSTDTAIVHLADAFGVGCLSIFTTHKPEWRVRDYPQAVPVALPVRGLPPALEFIRGEDDLAAIALGWRDGAALLDAALVRFLALQAG